jgi:ppGpp synthetase/RelA/SpoT-type nucleotidyltranferase
VSVAMPGQEPPATLEEYKRWALKALNVDYDSPVTVTEFEMRQDFVWNQAINHAFFKGIQAFLRESQEIYSRQKKARLFMTEDIPSVILAEKPYASMIEKSFRQNVIENSNFGSAPTNEKTKPGEWLTPDNWFSRVNDIVRTTIVCKYVDGPKFLAERLSEYANRLGLKNHYKSQQKYDGYYAYHFYLTIPVNMLSSDRELIIVDAEIEIQLTTQLQEAIRTITHVPYEKWRIQKEVDPNAWKWDLESTRFRAGYLSHTLHLLEAIIVEIRNASFKSDEK